jgi:hypothetical protein
MAVNAQVKSVADKNGQNIKSMTKLAKGTFEVKVTPLAAEENVGDPTIGRLSLDKTFSGDLTGTGKGQMLGIGTEIKDSGGYVAAERINGSLDGKKGTFALQHTGTMQGGKYEMLITVVPDSGTGELAGITGKMKIIIENGKHFYEFEYSFVKTK